MISVLTALAGTAAVTLHLIGIIRHQTYLTHWGIDVGLFPKTTDWLLTNGFHGLLDETVTLLSVVLSNLAWVAVAFWAVSAYIKLLEWTEAHTPPLDRGSLSPFARKLAAVVDQMRLPALATAAVVVSLAVFLMLMLIPAALGEWSAKAAIRRATPEYLKGCAASKYPCVSVMDNDRVVMTGYLLDSSPSHLAIFDAATQRGRSINRGTLEVRSTRAPGE